MRSLRSKIGLSNFELVSITVAIGVFAALEFITLSRSPATILREKYGSVLAAENIASLLTAARFFRRQCGHSVVCVRDRPP
jgi:hypothetical protein